ncbi:hypothetical protein JOM56_001854 [Amanita muscaria]
MNYERPSNSTPIDKMSSLIQIWMGNSVRRVGYLMSLLWKTLRPDFSRRLTILCRSRNLQHKPGSMLLRRGTVTTAGENTHRRKEVAKSNTELYLCTHPPSSIHRIPADVLCTIFETYCQVELYVNIPLLREFLPPQFIVCSAWRQIMLDIPSFWNKIRITFYYATSDDEMIELVEVSRMWLSRAKYLPCFIDFHFVPLATFENDTLCLLWKHEINKNIVRDLIASHKFKSLGVTFADYHLHGLLRLSDKRLSCIEVLCLHYVERPEEDYYVHDVVPQLDFHRLSNLTSFSLNMAMSSLEISGRGCQYFRMFSGIPWHQLRHVHLGVELPALRCLNILETCSSVLETCSLAVDEDLPFVSSPPSQIKPVHCPQLRELEVRIHPNIRLDDSDGDSFLFCLRLPKLKSLTLLSPVKNNRGQISISPHTLLRMQSVCTMSPEKLCISGLTCNVDAGALLASMPSLRSLELPKWSKLTVDVIRELGEGTIGPLIDELTIEAAIAEIRIDDLIQMVQTRHLSIGKEPDITVLLYCKWGDLLYIYEIKQPAEVRYKVHWGISAMDLRSRASAVGRGLRLWEPAWTPLR